MLWRQPNQTSFEYYQLIEEDSDSSKQVIIAPFSGEALGFGILEKHSIQQDDLSSFVDSGLDELENNAQIAKYEHIELVANAVDVLKQTSLQKVVLAREKVIKTVPRTIDLFLKFSLAYPEACVFLFNTNETGCWMGATPERLLSVENGSAKAASLAGTRPLNSKEPWSDKELEEQAIVTQSIQNTFEFHGLSNIQTTELTTKQAGPVEHLFCEVSGEMPDDLSSQELARALHPTPAVGGVPRKKALEFINTHEKIKREYYAGYFGISTAKRADYYVNLRSMKLFANGLVLYAGGGITAASDPEAEWEETERKLQTLLRFI